MKQKIWIARDNTTRGEYTIGDGEKPTRSYGGLWIESRHNVFAKEMCSKAFHRFCNIRLRKGQCVSVKMTHLKNGFKFEIQK